MWGGTNPVKRIFLFIIVSWQQTVDQLIFMFVCFFAFCFSNNNKKKNKKKTCEYV